MAEASMTWEIVFEGETGDALLTAHGTATVEGLDAMTAELLSDPRAQGRVSVLADYRDLDWNTMSAADLRRRAENVQRWGDRLVEARVAVVSNARSYQGLARMMDAYAAGFDFEWTVVTSLEDAGSWLRRG